MSIVIVDSKLAITLSATSLAMFIVLAMVVFALVMVQLCGHKGKAKRFRSSKVELTMMKEKSISPMHTFNTYESPVHKHFCSEEKVDTM